MVPEDLFHLGLCYVAGVSGLDPASCCSDLLLSLPGRTLSPRCRQPASGPDSRVHLRLMQQVFLSPGWTPDLARYFACLVLLMEPSSVTTLALLNCPHHHGWLLASLSSPLVGQPHSCSSLMCRPLCKGSLALCCTKNCPGP